MISVSRKLQFLVFLAAILTLPGRVDSAKRLNLYILDFDNLRSDPSVAWLSNGLVSMLEKGFGDVDGVRVYRREQLERILQDRSILLRQPAGTGNVLVMGSFARDLDQLTVDVQVINVANWEQLARVSASGSLNQVTMLADDIFARVSSALERQIPSPPKRGVIGEPYARAERPEYRRQVEELNFSLSSAVGELEKAMDLYIGSREETVGEGESHGKFYRDFSFAETGVAEELSGENAEMLETIISMISRNPYRVSIEKPRIEIHDSKAENVLLTVPIRYSLRETLIKDMLSSLPYTGIRQDGSLITLEFSRKRIAIPYELTERINRGEFRVVPVVQLLDREGRIRTVILDTSEPYWYRQSSENVRFMTEHVYSPLIVFTLSGWSLQVTMESVEIEANYELKLPRDEVASYSRVMVEFVAEPELAEFLSGIL